MVEKRAKKDVEFTFLHLAAADDAASSGRTARPVVRVGRSLRLLLRRGRRLGGLLRPHGARSDEAGQQNGDEQATQHEQYSPERRRPRAPLRQ